MSVVTVNGIDLELDLMDANVMEKYEAMNQEIVNKVQSIDSEVVGSTADKMRRINDYVREYFDEIFGEGTAEQVFGNCQKMDVFLDAFGACAAASKGLNEQVEGITAKYGFGRVMNREQRRHGAPQFNGQNRYNGN